MPAELGFSTAGGLEAEAPRQGGPAPALPCLNSNISIGEGIPKEHRECYNRLSANHRKAAFKLSKSVGRLCGKWGVERVGFLTLTFADHVTCAKEAGRRFNSLRSNVLAERYGESICVLERQKSGRIHFHLLVVLACDIRTGFSFDQAAAGDYRSANAQLRAEWAFWRQTAKLYGFGRTELMPVKSNEDGLSKYVGKYIAKHVGAREERDKGVRLVRYSRGASIGSSSFMFASARSKLWRHQLEKFAERNGCEDLAALREKFGRAWGYHQRAAIMAIEPAEGVIAAFDADGQPVRNPLGDVVTLRDVFEGDRMQFAASVAEACGATHADVFMHILNPGLCERLASVRASEEERRIERAAVAWAYAEQVARGMCEAAHLAACHDEDGGCVDRTVMMNDTTGAEGVGVHVVSRIMGSAARR